MVNFQWGLMGPDAIASTRRVRTLGLGAVVRRFNDAAVPGMGSLWYAKQLLWSLLGIHVATTAREKGMRVTNVEVANALEATASIIVMKEKHDDLSRIRGQQKLQGKDFCTFPEARKPNFYVSQPMRMGMVQPLRELDLVQGGATRFNSYKLSEKGYEFLERACKPYGSAYINKGVQQALLEWVQGKSMPWNSAPLKSCLNPYLEFSPETMHLFSALLEGVPKRKAAMAWLYSIMKSKQKPEWQTKPAELEQDHWHALYAGSRLFATRNAALQVLETVEKQLDKSQKGILPLAEIQAVEAVENLRQLAQVYLNEQYDDMEAEKFCQACVMQDDQKVLRHLIELDGRVVRMVGDEVVQGEAFQKGIGDVSNTPASADENPPPEPAEVDFFSQLPNISNRVSNLMCICQELQETHKGAI